MSSLRELDNAIQNLGASTAKDRKSAVQTFADLSDGKKAKLLSKNCLWGDLILGTIDYVEKEVSTSRKKTEDFGVVFLSVLRRAPLREGGWPLAPLIDKLMIRVWNWLTDGAVVEKSALASLDYIIKEPKYCNAIRRPTIIKLMKRLIHRIIEEEGELTQDSITYARIYANLVANYRRDILAEQHEGGEKSLEEWIRQVCTCCGYWMSKQRPDIQKNMKVFADVAEEIVGALNALIFKYGVNCILDLDFIPPDSSECLAEMTLSFLLRNYQHMHGPKAVTFLEALRLQLHLARARYPLPTPWAMHSSDPFAEKLDKIYRIVWAEAKGSARRIEEAARSMSRKGRELWVEPDYRDRLVWVLTAEVACAYQYQLNEGARTQAGRASDDEESVVSTATQSVKRLRTTGPIEQLRDALRVPTTLLPPPFPSSASGGATQASQAIGLSQVALSQAGGGGPGGVERSINVTSTLAALQVLTALFENFPSGGEAWLLDPKDTGEGVTSLMALLESVLETRSEAILLMWAAETLAALARLRLGKACTQEQEEAEGRLRGEQAPDDGAVMDGEAGQDKSAFSRRMTEAWRSLLKTLLRPDLKCWASTGKLHNRGLGESVLRLLTAIIEGRLVSDGDLVHLQDRLWALPAFHSTAHESPWPVTLLRVLVRNTEVLAGQDAVGSRDVVDLESSSMDVDDEDMDMSQPVSQSRDVSAASSRVERLVDYTLKWARGQVMRSKLPLQERCASLSLAMGTVLELCLSCTVHLATPVHPLTIGRLWTLTSPWQCLAEGHGEMHDRYVRHRRRLTCSADRHYWRKAEAIHGTGLEAEALRPASAWIETHGTAYTVTGQGRPLRSTGAREDEGGQLLMRVMQHLEAWDWVDGEGKKSEEADEEVIRAVLWLHAALSAGAVVEKGEEVVAAALRKAQKAPWRGVRDPSVLLVAMQELLSQLPVALDHGKGLDEAALLVHGDDSSAVAVADMSKTMKEAFVFLSRRAEEMLAHVLPSAGGGRSRASSEEEEELQGEAMEVVASRDDDSEGEELMRDIDEDDESPRPRGRGRPAAPRKEMSSPPRRTPRKHKLAIEIGQSRYTLQDLLCWCRLGLLINPHHTPAREFIQKAAGLAVDDADVFVDMAVVLEDALFRTTTSEEAAAYVRTLEKWVTEGREGTRRQGNSDKSTQPPPASVSEEIRYAVALRILTSLASGPAWLTEALQHSDAVSGLFSILAKTDLSWYNTLLHLSARRALFDNPATRGDDVSKALLSSIVSAANHVDYDVRDAATTALTSAFRVYSNRITLWETFRKKEVLVEPAKQSAEDPDLDVILVMGQLLALATVGREQGEKGRETDRITRMAVSSLCRWWGQCKDSPAICATVEAGLRDLAHALKYRAVAHLLRDHMGFLMHEWLVTHRIDLRHFPRALAGWPDMDEFVSDNMALLVPIVCLCQAPGTPSPYRFELLARLATEAGYCPDKPDGAAKDGRVSSAMTAHLVELKAVEVLLLAQHPSEGAVDARDELVAFCQRSCATWTEKDMEARLILPYIQDLILAVLDALAQEPYAYLEDVQEDERRVPPVTHTLEALATNVLAQSLDAVWAHCNAGEVLLHLKVRLAQATSRARASRLLVILTGVLQAMGEVACHESTLGLSLHVLLWALECHADLRLECLTLLDRFLSLCLGKGVRSGGRSPAELLGRHHLSAVVGSLYTLVVRGAGRGDYEDRVGDKAVELIRLLVLEERSLQPYTASLDPLPPLERDGAWEKELRVVRREMEDRAGDALLQPLAYARHLAATVERSAGLGRAGQVTRLVALQALQARLSRSPPRDAECLRLLVPTLLSITRDRKANPADVRLEAARALGAIGALPPCDLLVWEPPAGANPGDKKGMSPCVEAIVRALGRLVDLLTDAEAETVQLVLETLRSVLQTLDKDGNVQIRPEMAELISQMGPSKASSSSAADEGPTNAHGIRSEHRQILTSFSLSRVRPSRFLSSAAAPATSGRPQWSKDVWNPACVPYDQWVTTLTSTLIRHGLPNPLKESTTWRPTEEVQTLLRLLGACQRACQANAALAETLLPITVLGMIKGHPPTADVVERLSRCLSDVLPNAEPRRQQLLIQMLNFLREQCIYETLAASTSKGSGRRNSSGGASGKGGVKSLLGYLELNGLMVARAALRCGALSSALLFLELHREGQKDKAQKRDEAALLLDQVDDTQGLLLAILSRMAEMDGVHGVRQSNGLEFRARAGAARERADWRQALASFDSLMQRGQHQAGGPAEGVGEGVAVALQKLDLMHVLGAYVAGMQSRADSVHSTTLRELEYERRWRLCRWEPLGDGLIGPEAFVPQYATDAATIGGADAPLPSQEVGEASYQYHEYVHACLRALGSKDAAGVSRHLRIARLKTMACLTHEVPFEASRRLPQLLGQLQGLREVEEVAKVALTTGPVSVLAPSSGRVGIKDEAQSVLDTWRQRASRLSDDFELCEPLFALREVVVRALCPPLDAMTQAVAHACAVSHAARRGGNVSVASSAMSRLDHLLAGGGVTVGRCRWKLEQARVLWDSGEQDVAIRTAAAIGRALSERELRAHAADAESRSLMVEALKLAGHWMAEAGTEGTSRIIDEYLQPAVERAVSRSPQKKEARLTLATYLTGLYHRRLERSKGTEWAKEQEVFDQRRRELQACRAQLEGMQADDQRHRELRRRSAVLEKELKLDQEEHAAYIRSIDSFLLNALENYKEALIDGPLSEPDLGPVFQVTALWFDEANMRKAEVNAKMADLATHVPTYKFVPLIYQVLSMLGSEHEDFRRALEGLVRRVCSEHPHHTLLQLFGLSHGKRVNAADKQAYEGIPRLDDKIKAAERVLSGLKASAPLASLLANVDKLLEGYIALANTNTVALARTNHTKNVDFSAIPKALPIVQRFPHILGRSTSASSRGSASSAAQSVSSAVPAVLTHWPPLDPSSKYPDVVRVAGFEPRFTLADAGLSRPMIIVCLGSDGKKYRQVLKADDLRPDAVMMQVFDTMNTLLQQEPESRRRALRIRTYRIVSLTPSSGAMEFVENTKTLGSILVGGGGVKGLHERYNSAPGELRHQECRDLLKNAKDLHGRREAYHKIMESFHPAFRFFFFEAYQDPALWYRRRLHYTRSVASSSIVGYLLGIGDRHASNILIDQSNAGIVHIDFGYTFEQGKVLPQPETVPFRLTRDLVDAMGVTGTDGVFTQCCHVTMQVMRQHSASLLTILEVIARDPLHKWQAAALQTAAQEEEEGEGEEEEADSRHRRRIKVRRAGAASADAERVLLRVRQKLKGNEDPNGEAMSVQGHVKYLINQATDPYNLAVIYHGWSPYL